MKFYQVCTNSNGNIAYSTGGVSFLAVDVSGGSSALLGIFSFTEDHADVALALIKIRLNAGFKVHQRLTSTPESLIPWTFSDCGNYFEKKSRPLHTRIFQSILLPFQPRFLMLLLQ